jgi:hypothetical protein
MDRFSDTGADQIQRVAESPAQDSSCASGGEHRTGRNSESVTVDGGQLAKRLMHVYEVRPRNDHRGVDLISDALPFGRLCYGERD